MDVARGTGQIPTSYTCQGQLKQITSYQLEGETHAAFLYRHLYSLVQSHGGCPCEMRIDPSMWHTPLKDQDGRSVDVFTSQRPGEGWHEFLRRHEAAIRSEAVEQP